VRESLRRCLSAGVAERDVFSNTIGALSAARTASAAIATTSESVHHHLHTRLRPEVNGHNQKHPCSRRYHVFCMLRLVSITAPAPTRPSSANPAACFRHNYI